MSSDINAESAVHSEQIKTLFKAVDRAEIDAKKALELASSIERLSLNIESLTKQMERSEKAQNERMEAVERKVDSLTNEPANAWKGFKSMLLGVIVTIAVGGIIAARLETIIK